VERAEGGHSVALASGQTANRSRAIHHIGGQSLHCRLDAYALGLSGDLADFVFEASQSLRSNRSSDFWIARKTKSEELSLLRSRHRALCLIYLELEPLNDESRNALHHPVTRTLTAHIDVAVICVADVPVSPALQFAVEFIEHDIA
jgi:hypothetical protein